MVVQRLQGGCDASMDRGRGRSGTVRVCEGRSMGCNPRQGWELGVINTGRWFRAGAQGYELVGDGVAGRSELVKMWVGRNRGCYVRQG